MLLEILKYTLPALIVLFAVWLTLSKMLKNESEQRMFEIRKQQQNVTTPIRLRAYERLALLLERITPEHLLINQNITTMSVGDLQKELLQTIRIEMDHNLSQQVYVEDEVWQAVVLAKEEMINFVNACAMQMSEKSTALEYAQTLITAYNNNGETTIQKAQQILKDDAKKIF